MSKNQQRLVHGERFGFQRCSPVTPFNVRLPIVLSAKCFGTSTSLLRSQSAAYRATYSVNMAPSRSIRQMVQVTPGPSMPLGDVVDVPLWVRWFFYQPGRISTPLLWQGRSHRSQTHVGENRVLRLLRAHIVSLTVSCSSAPNFAVWHPDPFFLP